VLSLHASRGSLGMADPSALDAPSTKAAAAALAKLDGSGKVLIVCSGDADQTLVKSFRNLMNVKVLAGEAVGVADIVGASRLVLTPGAADQLTALARKEREEVAA
jgi:large subunit ribosomal protein L4